MEKKKARRAGRQRLCLLTPEERAARAEAVLGHLGDLPELRDALVVMAFAPLPEEVDLTAFWRRLAAAGVTVAFPVLAGEDGRMDAVPICDMELDLSPGRFSILQPREGVPLDPRDIDVVFVPALAYDVTGHRVGRGGGYYDRFLAGRAQGAFRCGVGFECQVVESLPAREHDCRMHAIVTEIGVRRLLGAPNCLSDVV